MITWFFVSSITLFIFSILEVDKKNQSLWQFLISLILSWFVVFCGSESTDYNDYVIMYSDYAKIDILDYFKKDIVRVEPFYFILNKLFLSLGFNFMGFFFFYSLALNYILLNSFYRYKNSWLIFLFFLTSSVLSQQGNLIRQMMSVALFIYSLRFLENKNIKSFIKIILIASGFHYSSLFLLFFSLAPFTEKYKKSSKVFIIIWFCSIIFSLGIINLDFTEYLKIYDFYGIYTTSDEVTVSDTKHTFSIPMNILFLLVIFLRNHINKSSDYLILFSFFCFIIISNLSVNLQIMARMLNYFSFSYLIIIPFLFSIKIFKSIEYQLFLKGIAVSYCLFLLFSFAFRVDASKVKMLGSIVLELSFFL